MNLVLVLALAVACMLPATVHGMYGARDAFISDYPFMAIVTQERAPVGNGVIVAPRWILTGASILKSPSDFGYSAVVGGDTLSTGTWYGTDRVYKHPEWASVYNVALLYLTSSIEYGHKVKPIAIAISTPDMLDVTILSYGENERSSGHLQQEEYIMTSDKSCTDSLQQPAIKRIVQNGRGYCILSAPGAKNFFSDNDIGAPAIANNELVALFSKAESDNSFVANRLAQKDIESLIALNVRKHEREL